MSPSTYSIHDAVEPDLATLAQHIHESKLALTINRLLWKDWLNDVAQRPQYTNAIGSSFKNPTWEIFKVVDESGLITSHMVLTLRKSAQAEPAVEEGDGEATTPDGPDRTNAEVFASVVKFVQETNTVKDVEHLEVTHIFVKTTYRRRGIGSQLVQLGIEKAEKAGILGAEPEAHDFFLSLGYKDTSYTDVNLSRWPPKYSGFGVFRFREWLSLMNNVYSLVSR